MNSKDKPSLEQIIEFIRSIGIPVDFCSLEKETFVPGILISKGALLVDVEKLKWPGDLLHEAGHIALLSPQQRAVEEGDLESEKEKQTSLELGVICWTWAAICHLNLEPKIVFHADGYKGESSFLIQNFLDKNYVGLPLLEWMGLTYSQKNAFEKRESAFPHMRAWMRMN